MAFQYFDIEEDVTEKLQRDLQGVAEVIVLPEVPAKYKKPDDIALVVVTYAGSDFEPPSTNDMVSQVENVNVLCNVSSSSLRDELGVYNIVRLVKKSLQGYKPANMLSRFFLKSVEFDDRDDSGGIFSYNVQFACKKMQVQDESDQPQGESLRLENVTLREDFN